jgi:hypothetical protein
MGPPSTDQTSPTPGTSSVPANPNPAQKKLDTPSSGGSGGSGGGTK